MNAPRKGQTNRPSTWTRARRDLASPQGVTLMIALMLSFLITVIGLLLENYLKVPRNIVFLGILISYIVIVVVAMGKIIAKNRRAAKARREAYQQKFEQNMEAIKAWDGRKKSGEKNT